VILEGCRCRRFQLTGFVPVSDIRSSDVLLS
jgi:hypothetical protein